MAKKKQTDLGYYDHRIGSDRRVGIKHLCNQT